MRIQIFLILSVVFFNVSGLSAQCAQQLAGQSWSGQQICPNSTTSYYTPSITFSLSTQNQLTITNSGFTLYCTIDCANNTLIFPSQRQLAVGPFYSGTGTIQYNVNGFDVINYTYISSSGGNACSVTMLSNVSNVPNCSQNLANRQWSIQHDCGSSQTNTFAAVTVTPNPNDVNRLQISSPTFSITALVNCIDNNQTVPYQSISFFGQASGTGTAQYNVNGVDRLSYTLTNSIGRTCNAILTSNPNNVVSCTQTFANRQWSAITSCNNGMGYFPTVSVTNDAINPALLNLSIANGSTITAIVDCSNNTINVPYQSTNLCFSRAQSGTGSILYRANGIVEIIYNMVSSNNEPVNITLTSNPTSVTNCAQSANSSSWMMYHTCDNGTFKAVTATAYASPTDPDILTFTSGNTYILSRINCLNNTISLPTQQTSFSNGAFTGTGSIMYGVNGTDYVRYALSFTNGAVCSVTMAKITSNYCANTLASQSWSVQEKCNGVNNFSSAIVSPNPNNSAIIDVSYGSTAFSLNVDCFNNIVNTTNSLTGPAGPTTLGYSSVRYNLNGTDVIYHNIRNSQNQFCNVTLTSNPYNTVSCTQQLGSQSWTMQNGCTGNGNTFEQVTVTSPPSNPALLKITGSIGLNLLVNCSNNTFSAYSYLGNPSSGIIEYNVNGTDRMSFQNTDPNGNACSVTFTSNPYNTVLCTQSLANRNWSIQSNCTSSGAIALGQATVTIDANNPALLTFAADYFGLSAIVDCLNNTLSVPSQSITSTGGNGRLMFNVNGTDMIIYNFIDNQNNACTSTLTSHSINQTSCIQSLVARPWSIQHNCIGDSLSEFGQAIVTSQSANSALLTFTTNAVTLTSIVDCTSNTLIAPNQWAIPSFNENSSATGHIVYNINGSDQITYVISSPSRTCTATLTSNPYNTVSCTQNLANQTWSYQHDCNNYGSNTFFGQAVVSTDATNPALLRINIGQFPNLEYMSLSTFIDCANNTLTAPAQFESINGSQYTHLTMPGTGTVQYNVNGVDRIAFSLTQWGMQTCRLTLTSNPYNTVTCARTIASQSWTSQVVNAPLNTNTFGNATVTEDNIDPNKLLIKFIEASSFADSFTVYVDCINSTISYPKQINVDAGAGILQLGTITEDKIILPIISSSTGYFYNGITLTSNPRNVVSCTQSLSNRQWFIEHTCDNIPKIFSRVSTPVNVNNPALFTFELRDSFSMMFFKLHSLFDCNANTLTTPFQITDNGYYAGSANIQYNVNGTDRISFALTDLNSSTCTTTLTSNPYNTSSCTRTLGNRPWDFQKDCPFAGSASGQATVSEIPSNPGLLRFDLIQGYSSFYAYTDCNNNLLSVPDQILLPASQTGQGNISYNVNGLDRIALLTYDNGNNCTITMTSNPNNIINCASLLTSQNYSATVDQNGSITTQSGSITASNNNPSDINISLPGIRANLNATVNCSNSSFSFSNQNVSVTTVNGSGNFAFSQNGINTVTLTLSNGYRITLTNAVASNPTCVQQMCARPWNIVENTNGTLVNYVATVTQTGQLNTVELRYGTRNIVLNVDCATDSLFMPTQLIDGNLYDGSGRFVLGANGRDSMFLSILLKSGFSLSFGRPTVVAIEEPTISSAKVFSTDNNQIVIQVENGSTDNFSFVCYDVLGRCIMRKDNLSGETSSVPLTNQKQVLFWSIEREGRVLHSGKLLH